MKKREYQIGVEYNVSLNIVVKAESIDEANRVGADVGDRLLVDMIARAAKKKSAPRIEELVDINLAAPIYAIWEA